MPQDEYFEAERMPRAASSANSRSAYDPWGDMPHERRVRWTQMMLDFRPRFLGVLAMNHLTAGGVAPAEDWAHTARGFEAAGFTPEQYHWLHTCIRLEQGDEPHRLVTVTRTRGPRDVTLSPFDWEPWLRNVEAGVRPMEATRRVLARGARGDGQA